MWESILQPCQSVFRHCTVRLLFPHATHQRLACKWKAEEMRTSHWRESEAESGRVDCSPRCECEADESCIEKRITLVVRLRMSDSPKPGRAGSILGASSPMLTPTFQDHQDDAAGMKTRAPCSSSSAYTREENDAAELVLEQLDDQWFCDNVVRWPLSRPCSPPGVIDRDVATSPFRPRREFGLSSSTQIDIATGVVIKPRLSTSERALNPPRSRRLSDGDHLRRYFDSQDQLPRRRVVEAEDQHHRRFSDAQSASLPQTPTKLVCNEGFSPLAQGPLMGVTEDEEIENDLYTKMLAKRPAKLTTISPGRFSLGSLRENQTSVTPDSLPAKRKPQPRQRRRLKGTKSLTDLEYEELRGFKDLGFEVSKGDLTPHVVRMFPGLQRQGIPPYNSPQRHESQSQSCAMVPHVQHLLWPRGPDSPLRNAPFLDPSVDMKGQLKSWASEMASIVSIEC